MLTISFDSGVHVETGTLVTAAVASLNHNKGYIFCTSQNLGFEDQRQSHHFELLGLNAIITQSLEVIGTHKQVRFVGDNSITMNRLNGNGCPDIEVIDDLRLVNHINMMLINHDFKKIKYSRKSKHVDLGISVSDSICDWMKKAIVTGDEGFLDTIKSKIRNKLTGNTQFNVDIEHFDNYDVIGF